MQVSSDELRQMVERLHACQATLRRTSAVVERLKGHITWAGIVQVFHLTGHPTATICYAWSSAIENSDRRRFYAVLRVPPIKTPLDAVRASILDDQRATQLDA